MNLPDPTIHLTYDLPFATITLNRPAAHNAMNLQMANELIAAFEQLNTNDDVRAVVITGAGDHFCAGDDLRDLRVEVTSDTYARFDLLLRTISRSPKVIVAKVAGTALGIGLGLVCVSDITLANTEATFGLPEARLGLAPAIIAPYVIRRIGLSRARLLMLTGVRFDGVSAHEYGVVHEVCPLEILDECVEAILTEVRQCSPAALAACKTLIGELTPPLPDDSLDFRVQLFDALRRGEDGREGMNAIAEARAPRWTT